MEAEKRRRFRPDPRTWLLLCLLGIAAILVIRSEIGCLCLFLACLLIHLLAGNGGKILPYGLYYLIFYGIGWLGVQLMDSGLPFRSAPCCPASVSSAERYWCPSPLPSAWPGSPPAP